MQDLRSAHGQQQMYEAILRNLDAQFDREFPASKRFLAQFDRELPASKRFLKPEEAVNEFYKWYMFWNNMRPKLNDPEMVMNQQNVLLTMKATICEQHIMNLIALISVYDELEKQNLYHLFEEKIASSP